MPRPAATLSRETALMAQIQRPGTFHDRFCRCRRCKPAHPADAITPADATAIACILIITAVTCGVML